MEKIFLTGITGLVGSAFVVALLRERQDYEIVCLARKTAVKSAQQRTEEVIRDECRFDGCPELADRILKSVKVIEGDVTTINPEELAKNPLLAGTTIIFHCAADVNLGKDPTGRTYRINYNGTENMVKLAQLLKVKEFHYVGTAYIAGKLVGTAFENMPIDNGFNNPYEESKFKAEMLVRNSGIPFTIYRPAIITGRRSDGRIRKPLAFYRILEFLGKLKSHYCTKHHIDHTGWANLQINFATVPSEHVYFVPIDYVQEAITALFQQPVNNQAYHITGESPLSTHQIEKLHLPGAPPRWNHRQRRPGRGNDGQQIDGALPRRPLPLFLFRHRFRSEQRPQGARRQDSRLGVWPEGAGDSDPFLLQGLLPECRMAPDAGQCAA
ncbi:MAG: SDR family oxidoreductase [Lentisphaeria bacterium]|nr:MAG: SDR family oxidoreductase [Lentisphaeria bacterium]